MRPLLRLDGIAQRFGGVHALKGIDLAVPRGELLGLIGPNGAGKTTLFNVVAGSLRPTAGRVLLSDEDVTDLRPDARCRRGIARTFQIPRPFGQLTVAENIAVAHEFGRGPVDGRPIPTVSELLDGLALSPWRDAKAAVLPLGARKRLEVARALAANPELLLLDEVMGGLSAREVDEVLLTVRRLRERLDLTIVMIEHVLRAVLAVADRVLVLDQGRLIATGTPEAIQRDPAVIDAYLGQGVAA